MITLGLFRISDFSENILLISLQQKPGEVELTDLFFSLSEHLRSTKKWIEVVSGEDSLIVKYNLFKTNNGKAKEDLERQVRDFNYREQKKAANVLTVPICYSEEFALDIQDLKTSNSLSSQDIAELHSSHTYKVKMIGFTPGFAYLGELSQDLLMPRHSAPRLYLPPGSIGITGKRTGIYPLGGPGGWQIIGCSPMSLFDSNSENPFRLLTGMQVKFVPISSDQFQEYRTQNKQ